MTPFTDEQIDHAVDAMLSAITNPNSEIED